MAAQAIELSADALSNVKFIQEKKVIQKYFDEISQVPPSPLPLPLPLPYPFSRDRSRVLEARRRRRRRA